MPLKMRSREKIKAVTMGDPVKRGVTRNSINRVLCSSENRISFGWCHTAVAVLDLFIMRGPNLNASILRRKRGRDSRGYIMSCTWSQYTKILW